jgi:hypothetical protein
LHKHLYVNQLIFWERCLQCTPPESHIKQERMGRSTQMWHNILVRV